ncbi:MAG: rhodanese-like domain-containing protein [Rhodospirillales bacterium]|nr:MAG: rhodanese-like domain-containing protein [Rhodospirillales bacterium]
MSQGAYAGDIPPREAWRLLESDGHAALVDVRTPAEWAYVGVPDLSRLGKQPVFVPWARYPTMEINPNFAEEVAAAGIQPRDTVLLLCRSGVRSRSAAIALTAAGFTACYNIDAGFEGDPDSQRHRGTVSGWKVSGLPWVQG